MAHVGDSRLYLCDGTELDAADARRLVGGTVLGQQGRRRGPQATRHVLTNVLGARPDTQVHLLERELSGDETLLLCSDGLHGSVPHETLRNIVASKQELPAARPIADQHGARTRQPRQHHGAGGPLLGALRMTDGR